MVMLGALAAAFTLGGLLVLAARGSGWLAAAALLSGAGLSVAAAAYHLFTLRPRKISIRRLLDR